MLYEFKIKCSFNQLDQTIETLNIAGLYNLYYEPLIKIKKVKNGYDYEEVSSDYVDVRIYGETSEVTNLPQAYLDTIHAVLSVPKDKILVNKLNVNQWNSSFEDIELGNDWVLCYSGSYDQYPQKKLLKFEPQAAFGTGLHQTTQDCLRVILEQNFTTQSVLDLGTGSGVLTIAVALKCAAKIVAVDYEPVEREIKHNLKLNELEESRVKIEQADLLSGEYSVEEDYDWIFINIGADETVRIIKRHNLLQKSSNFLISGVVDWNSQELVQLFADSGFTIEKKRQSNEWITYYFTR